MTWTRRDVPDCLWPTTNDDGVPELPLAYAADAIDAPAGVPAVHIWGSRGARRAKWRGTICTYTDDYRFEGLWDNPSHLLNTECRTVVEVNFSIFEQMPRAMAAFQVYRKRWLARWWGSKGVRILVDLNVAERWAELNMLGVPAGWPAYATRGYCQNIDWIERQYRLAVERCGDESKLLFLVYGGGREVELACRRIGPATIVWAEELRTQLRREAIERKAQLKLALVS